MCSILKNMQYSKELYAFLKNAILPEIQENFRANPNVPPPKNWAAYGPENDIEFCFREEVGHRIS